MVDARKGIEVALIIRLEPIVSSQIAVTGEGCEM
jgi:hypothetical protein